MWEVGGEGAGEGDVLGLGEGGRGGGEEVVGMGVEGEVGREGRCEGRPGGERLEGVVRDNC